MMDIFNPKEVEESLSKDYILYYCNDFYAIKDKEQRYIYHNLNGPAKVYYKGLYKYHICYFEKNNLHRIKNPACFSYKNEKIWYKNGLRHRFNAPAYIYNNTIKYYEYDFIVHRLHK